MMLNIKRARFKYLPIAAIVVGLIGVVFLITSSASRLFIAVELEDGNNSKNVTVASDGSASGGQYVVFGDSSGVLPSECQKGERIYGAI